VKTLLFILVGAVAGVLTIGGVRYTMQEPPHTVHFHANWAIFVDGARLPLTENRYMEDVMTCAADAAHQDPEDRVHMHVNNHDIVHVHAPGVAWGHLLSNLDFGLGDDYLYTDQARLESTPERSLKFILNGKRVSTIRNVPIRDQDRLLISFGPESVEEVIATQFPQVASDAAQYNEMPDPASCSGAIEETMGSRLRRAFWY